MIRSPVSVKRLVLLASAALIAFVVFPHFTVIADNGQSEKEVREEFLNQVSSEEQQRIAELRAKLQSLRENKGDIGNLPRELQNAKAFKESLVKIKKLSNTGLKATAQRELKKALLNAQEGIPFEFKSVEEMEKERDLWRTAAHMLKSTDPPARQVAVLKLMEWVAGVHEGGETLFLFDLRWIKDALKSFKDEKLDEFKDDVEFLRKGIESRYQTVLPITPAPVTGVVVKGHVRTATGKPLAKATIRFEAPKPTPRDFVTGVDSGWDTKKDAAPPVIVTSHSDGAFGPIATQAVPGVVTVSGLPVKDMTVTLDTRERYIARLKPGTDPTKFVSDHGLQDVKIISVPSETGGGPLVTYPVPSDEKKAKELQDAISKDDRVAFAESNDCREIQPNGRSEAMTIAYDYNTLVVGAGCDTMTMLISGPGDTEPVPAPMKPPKKKPEKWAVVVGVEDNPTLPVTGFANEGFHDANEFAQLLLKTGFAPEDLNPRNPKTPKEGTHMVTLLAGTNVGKELLPLLDAPLPTPRGPGVAATNKRIDDALTWLAQVAKADDMVVFYFSGHGNADKTGAWFFSSDAKFAAQLLANKIQNITAQKKLIILDFSKAEAFKSALEGLNGVILFGAETDKSISGQAIGRSVHKANGEQFHRHHPLTWELLRLWGKAPRPLRVPLKLEHFPTYFKLPENTDGLTLCGQLIPKNK